jgi:2-succinyl-6-hydroxy-2,4-cyclohexadiene-1-carboxylate synthase
LKTVFLHGLGGSKEDWRKVTVSQPSILLNIEEELNFLSTAKSIALQLQDLGEPIFLVGYSMGGRIALQVSEFLPAGLVKGIVLISTGFGFSSLEEQKKRREIDEKWALLAEEDPEGFWISWYKQEIFASFLLLEEREKSSWLQSRKQLSPKIIANQFRLLGQGTHADLLFLLEKRKKEGVPLLYLAGEKDKKYAELAKKMDTLGIPSALAKGAGHILPLEAPKFLVEKLESFLK